MRRIDFGGYLFAHIVLLLTLLSPSSIILFDDWTSENR